MRATYIVASPLADSSWLAVMAGSVVPSNGYSKQLVFGMEVRGTSPRADVACSESLASSCTQSVADSGHLGTCHFVLCREAVRFFLSLCPIEGALCAESLLYPTKLCTALGEYCSSPIRITMTFTSIVTGWMLWLMTHKMCMLSISMLQTVRFSEDQLSSPWSVPFAALCM